jgi:putative tryptophan/tyrosine transport system substrate-binding protein
MILDFRFWILDWQKAWSGKDSEKTHEKKFMGHALRVMHSALCFVGVMLFALSIAAHAQEPKQVPRIGILSLGKGNPTIDAFRQGLHELGWVDGENIALEYRWAEENEEHFPRLAAELVRINVDIILVTTTQAANAAKKLTKTIPIVVTVIPGSGEYRLVDSLHRPGGNVTGLSFMSSQLSGRRLELLKEVIPTISRVAVFSDANLHLTLEAVARSLSVQLQIVPVKKLDEIEDAFSAAVRGKAEAVTVGSHAMFVLNRTRIVEMAAKCRLPAIYHRKEFVEAGGLMSYGPNHADLYRRAAIYVDKILKGAKPADLPVEQPTKFELVINLKTAKAIGVTIPPDVLMWADRVIK